jgi:zinc transport system substrate-binding protein
MRPVRAALGALVLSLVVMCAQPAAARADTEVVAGFYPVAAAAERVGGGRVSVTNLTPAGAEPHDLELTPKQVDAILDADVAFVMGRRFQPAVEASARQRDGPTVALLGRLPIDPGTKPRNEGDPDALDPHVWLDPVLMRAIVREVQSGLTQADPGGRSTYAANADRYVAELDALDARYRTGLANCRRSMIVTSHAAFGHLAKQYGLRHEGAVGLSPDAEPDPQRIAELADLAEREGVTVIFTETLVSPRIADTLARETGVDTDVLNPLEGLTAKEADRGETYVSIMDANLAKLRHALGCT